jgi:hypothetical protein
LVAGSADADGQTVDASERPQESKQAPTTSTTTIRIACAVSRSAALSGEGTSGGNAGMGGGGGASGRGLGGGGVGGGGGLGGRGGGLGGGGFGCGGGGGSAGGGDGDGGGTCSTSVAALQNPQALHPHLAQWSAANSSRHQRTQPTVLPADVPRHSEPAPAGAVGGGGLVAAARAWLTTAQLWPPHVAHAEADEAQ